MQFPEELLFAECFKSAYTHKEKAINNKNAPIRNLRVEALGGVTPLTNFIINTTAIAKSK